MLSIFLTEELERHSAQVDNADLVFFFCSAPDEKRNTAVGVLRGLVHQIIDKRPQLVKHALPYFRTPDRTQHTLSSLEALWLIFEELIADATLRTLFCVLDGLDECDESTLKKLLPRLVGLFTSESLSSTKGTFRLAIVSRDILSLRGCTTIRLDPDNDEKVVGDIELFVSTRIQQLSRIDGFNDSFRSSVKAALLERAEGTFLWVGFAIHELLQKQTCSEIWEALEDLPSGLPAIYSRMLLRIPAERRAASQAILRWVVMAARPLQLQELAAAIEIRPTSPLLTTDRAMRDAITDCALLLRVKDQDVSLVHQSARDYLQRKERDSNAVIEGFRIEIESSHLELAQKCLDCIEQSILQQRMIDFNTELDCQESPLLRYAILHWPEHAMSCSARNAELLPCLQQFLCTKHALRRHWWAAYRKEKRLSLPQTMPLLHVLCYLGCLTLVQIEVGWERFKPRFLKRINRRDSNGNTALHVATRAQDQKVLQVLIDNGAEVDTRNKDNKTALHQASEAGHEEMVRLLLCKGADVNAGASDGKTVLHCALSTRGNNAVVRMLLSKGANVNAKDKFGVTALHLATWELNMEIMQLLVNGGAEVNARDSVGRTALGSAAKSWRQSEAAVQTLLNKGADVNTKESNGSTVLHWAAEAGNKTVVQLLVDMGAIINAKDNDGRTALHWAASEVQVSVVWLLLRKGADIKAKTNDGETVLHEAVSALGGAWRGNELLVELLISMGSDFKAKNKDGKTALRLAIEQDNKAVVRLLKTEEWTWPRRRTRSGRQQLEQRLKFLEALAHW